MNVLSSALHYIRSPIDRFADVFIWGNMFFWKNDPKLCAESRSNLEKTVQTIATKMGIQKPIHVIESPKCLGMVQSTGSTLPIGRAGIVVNPRDYRFLNAECKQFFITHEIAHLKHGHLLQSAVIFCGSFVVNISALLTSVFLSQRQTPEATSITTRSYLVGFSTLIVMLAATTQATAAFSRRMERMADTTACLHCSSQIIKAVVTFLKNTRYDSLQWRSELLNSPSFIYKALGMARIDHQGNDRWAKAHPPISERITYLENFAKDACS